MRVAVHGYRHTCGKELRPPHFVGEETVFRIDVFRIYFNHYPGRDGMAHHVVDQSLIPLILLQLRIDGNGILGNLVEMAEHVEAARSSMVSTCS